MEQVPPLRAENLRVGYGRQTVLRDVTLEAYPGEMLGLIGPNGAGKTTLLKTISGILEPQKGQVYVTGTNVRKLQLRERAKKIAMVSQQPATPAGFTALDLVLMGRNPHLGWLEWEGPQDLEIARRVMRLTDTWRFADRRVSTLSGGERQRVFIARALAQDAPLLLLDEPTANLDIGYQTEIMNLIRKIRRETGVTVVASMHDLSLAGQYCDRIAVLHQGTIASLGAPADVCTPEMISRVYRTPVTIIKHPINGTPVVLVQRAGDREN